MKKGLVFILFVLYSIGIFFIGYNVHTPAPSSQEDYKRIAVYGTIDANLAAYRESWPRFVQELKDLQQHLHDPVQAHYFMGGIQGQLMGRLSLLADINSNIGDTSENNLKQSAILGGLLPVLSHEIEVIRQEVTSLDYDLPVLQQQISDLAHDIELLNTIIIDESYNQQRQFVPEMVFTLLIEQCSQFKNAAIQAELAHSIDSCR